MHHFDFYFALAALLCKRNNAEQACIATCEGGRILGLGTGKTVDGAIAAALSHAGDLHPCRVIITAPPNGLTLLRLPRYVTRLVYRGEPLDPLESWIFECCGVRLQHHSPDLTHAIDALEEAI